MEVRVKDDIGKVIVLKHPAQRIVSLAPHTTELLFAAGAGGKVVGVAQYSDYPAAAKKIPRVGGYGTLDLEAILALQPDLVLGWQSGNPPHVIRKLQAFGLQVFVSEPLRINDIADTIERIGRMAATEHQARSVSTKFREEHRRLHARYAGRKQLTVFYQVWDRPLMTINGKHLITRIIELCGGLNIFAGLKTLAPTVSLEAVVAANPDVIITGGRGRTKADWLAGWRKWSRMNAVRHNSLYVVDADTIQRHTPRILIGAQQMCRKLEQARGELEARD